MKNICFVASLVAVVLMVSGCNLSPQNRYDRFMQRGKDLSDKREYTRAVLEFRNAAQLMPSNAEAWYQLGMALVEVKDVTKAYGAFQVAVEKNPKHAQAQLRLAQMMAVTRDPDLEKEAKARLQALVEGGGATPEALNTLAWIDLTAGDTSSAEERLKQALAISPGEIRSAGLLARSRLVSKDPKGAEEVLQKLCQGAPKSSAARRLLAEFYLSQSRLADAEAQLKSALAIDPKDGAAMLSLARVQVTTGRKPEAEASFRALSGMGKEYRNIYGSWLLQQTRVDESLREFERLYGENSEDRQSRSQLVYLYRLLGRNAEAEQLITNALAKNPKDVDALVQRAEIRLSTQKLNEAENDLNEVLKQQSNSAAATYGMARLNLARGQMLRYREGLHKALELDPRLLNVRLELAQVLTAGKSVKPALDLLDKVPADEKGSLPVLIQRNWVLWAAGNLKDMRKGIDDGLARSRNTQLLLQDGLLRLRSGDTAGGREALQEALKLNPGDIKALVALSSSYMHQKQTSTALAQVREVAAQLPKSAEIQEFLAMLLVVQGDRAQARTALEKAKALEGRSTNAEMTLTQLDAMEGKWDEAHKRLQKVLSEQPSNARARLWMGNVELVRQNQDGAVEQFRKAVEANPDNAEALNNLAYALMEFRKQTDEALKYAQKAQELMPDQPEYADTLGWIMYQKGVYPTAVRYLERATQKGDRAVWKYHLAMAYARSGDLKKAKTTLDAALKRDPKAPEAKLAMDIVGRQ
jgi:tetratricopeptide (TPR) repeat protein